MFLAISILMTALALLFCACAGNTKLEIRDRFLHIRYVLIALVYVITCACLFARLLNLISRVVSMPVVRNLLFMMIPPGNSSAGFYWIITL